MVLAHDDWLPDRDYHVIEGNGDEDILFITGNSRMLRVSKDLGRRLRLGLAQLTRSESTDWNSLADAEVISGVNGMRTRSSTFMDGASLALNINLTAFCNLGCSYCFADGGDYGRITGKLESAMVGDILDFAKTHVTSSGTVRFEFFGGEPLLNFQRIQEVCAAAEVVERETGIHFLHRISTNLTVLPEGALDLFAKHQFVVSVSIDGDQVTHDRNRPTKGGKGTWDRIIKHCRKVRSVSDELTLVARMTVLGGRPTLRDNVRALWEINLFDYFQIYPGVVPATRSAILGDEAQPTLAVRKTMSAEFLAQLAEFALDYQSLYSQNNRFKGVLEYERIADMILDGKTALSFCSGGRNYFTFSPDRSIMPCHRLVGDTSFQVGQSQQGLSGRGLDGWRLPIDDHPICGTCWVRYVCGGGCKQENFQATGDINRPSTEGCAYQMQLVDNIVNMIAQAGDGYRERNRTALNDLFVSCGRPIVVNLRAGDAAMPPEVMAFRLL